jgi:L-malate glycosyltransferase
MKKICIVTPEFPPRQWGGLARTVGKVAVHARDMGLQVHVAHFTVVPDSVVLLDENRETADSDGITYHHITVAKERIDAEHYELWDCPHTLTLQMMYQSLEMLQRTETFDLFHPFFLYPVGYVTGLLARRLKIPSVATIVGNDVKRYIFSPEKTAVCRSGLENADRIVVLSRDLMEMADALTPIADKCTTVYNSVNIPEQQWSGGRVGDGSFRIGCAGIFKYAKGLPYLFKGLAALERRREVALELRGKLRSSEQAIFNYLVKETGIEAQTRLLDPLPHDWIPGWLESLDVFVLPSLTEGCPNILMEAMASGLPCIATRTGAVEDMMQDHVSGLVVPWGDSQALTEALKELMDNSETAKAYGEAARKRMREFSRQREYKAWEQVYRDLIEF